MFKNILSNNTELNWLPEIILVLFMLIFIGAGLYAYYVRKEFVTHMSNLPFDDGTINNSENTNEVENV